MLLAGASRPGAARSAAGKRSHTAGLARGRKPTGPDEAGPGKRAQPRSPVPAGPTHDRPAAIAPPAGRQGGQGRVDGGPGGAHSRVPSSMAPSDAASNPHGRSGAPGGSGPARVSFTWREAGHLAVAVVVLTYCFALVRANAGRTDPLDVFGHLLPPVDLLVAALLAVTTGFVLHELAHKVVAQRYGYWAEFRAGLVGLVVALGMALVGLLVALPGATWIQGRVTRRESGIVSLAGPALNFLVAWLAFPLSAAVNANDPVPLSMGMVTQVNSVLATFNLVPLNFVGTPLDGRKVLRWNVWVWLASFAACVVSAIYINGRLLQAW